MSLYLEINAIVGACPRVAAQCWIIIGGRRYHPSELSACLADTPGRRAWLKERRNVRKHYGDDDPAWVDLGEAGA